MVPELRDMIAIEAMKIALDRLRANNTEVALTQLAAYSYKVADSMMKGRYPEDEQRFARPIEELDLTLRTYNCLNLAGLKTLKDLIQYSKNDLLRLPNLGRKSLLEIITKLKLINIKLVD